MTATVTIQAHNKDVLTSVGDTNSVVEKGTSQTFHIYDDVDFYACEDSETLTESPVCDEFCDVCREEERFERECRVIALSMALDRFDSSAFAYNKLADAAINMAREFEKYLLGDVA